MTLTRNHVEWLSLVFFVVLVGIVFQQIQTDLVKQGIAGGDAFHDAAFFPKSVALLILGTVGIRAVTLTLEIRRQGRENESRQLNELFRPVQLVCLFGLYLYLLDLLGYHLATTPFVVLVMFICGDRKPLPTLLFSVTVAFSIAFIFEYYLKIVLPGGIFSLNIPW